MKLEKFKKMNKQKRILIGACIGLILTIGGITLYKTFALYNEEKTFNVLRGRIPKFINSDLELAVTIDGKPTNTIPQKADGYFIESINCNNEVEGTWDNKNWTIILNNLRISKVICSLSFRLSFSQYIINQLQEEGSSLVKVSHEATSQTPVQNDYRYIGSSPNNYVCLSEENPCPSDKLFRVLGVFSTKTSSGNDTYEEVVKLITASSIGKYQWNTSESAYWAGSSIYKALNNDYWNSLGENQKYVEASTWYIGGFESNANSAEDFYKQERGSTGARDSNGITYYTTNIGLMYPSDYAYSLNGNGSSIPENNKGAFKTGSWLFIGGYQWCINASTKLSSASKRLAFSVSYEGGIVPGTINGSSNYAFATRPTFYLKRTTLYKSGDGSLDNPYRIELIQGYYS